MLDYKKLMEEAESRFEKINNLISEKVSKHNEEIAELEAELLRIQGEYRLLVDLKEKDEAVESETAE